MHFDVSLVFILGHGENESFDYEKLLYIIWWWKYGLQNYNLRSGDHFVDKTVDCNDNWSIWYQLLRSGRLNPQFTTLHINVYIFQKLYFYNIISYLF